MKKLHMMAMFGAIASMWREPFEHRLPIEPPTPHWRDTQTEADRQARLEKAQQKRDRKRKGK